MRAALVVVAIVFSLAAPVAAVTIRDIIELSRAGLNDEVIVALIEIDQTRFELDAARLLELKEAGVSDRVLVAILRSGRQDQGAQVDADRPQVSRSSPKSADVVPRAMAAVSAHQYTRRGLHFGSHHTFVPVPVFVPVHRHPAAIEHLIRDDPSRFSSFGTGFMREVDHLLDHSSAHRTYWGWGGKLRPDAWGQPRPVDRP